MKTFIQKIIYALAIIIVIAFYFIKGAIFDNDEYVEYSFRNQNALQEHYEKHGKEMGFEDVNSYCKAASDVVNNPSALHKKEAEDNDDVYYLEESNEFVIVSSDGYIRTYFYPDNGKSYFDGQ